MSADFHVVPSNDVPSLMAIAAMRPDIDAEIAARYVPDPARILELREEMRTDLVRLDRLIAAAIVIGAFKGSVVGAGDVRSTASIGFDLEDGTTLRLTETTGNGGTIQALCLGDADGDTTIAFGSVARSDRVIVGRMMVPDVRRRIGRLAWHAEASLDRMLGRNGHECTPNAPATAVDAAEACIRIVGDRLRVPGNGERTGMHAFATPWSSARTVVDDVAGTAPTAEAAWLPHIAVAHVRRSAVRPGTIRLALEPLSIRTRFTPADAIQHMRSIAAVSIYRPEDE